MTKTRLKILTNRRDALISLLCNLKDYRLCNILLKDIRKLNNKIKGEICL